MQGMRFIIRNWWLSLLIGLLMIGAGIWLLATPLQSYIALAAFFSLMILVSGVFEIAFSLSNRKEYQGWGWYFVSGVFDLIVGSILILHPALSLELLPFLVGFWLLFRGAIAIGSALELKSYGAKEWWILLLSGLSVLLFALLILFYPVLGGISLVAMTSMAFIMAGIFRIHLSFKLKIVKKMLP